MHIISDLNTEAVINSKILWFIWELLCCWNNSVTPNLLSNPLMIFCHFGDLTWDSTRVSTSLKGTHWCVIFNDCLALRLLSTIFFFVLRPGNRKYNSNHPFDEACVFALFLFVIFCLFFFGGRGDLGFFWHHVIYQSQMSKVQYIPVRCLTELFILR